MSSFVKPVAFVFLALFAACAADKPAPSPTETKLASLSDPSVSTDQATYAAGSTITVTYANLAGNVHDWIAIATAGSANNSYVDYVYTNGQTSGTATFTAPAGGTYVARALLNDSPTLAAESTPFTVQTVSVSTDQSHYLPGATITVTYAGLPGNAMDWISIAPAGSANNVYLDYVYTNGQTSGTATFTAPAEGTYVARALLNDSPTLAGESTPFTVATIFVSTNKSTYAPGETVTVTYAGLPGNAMDWISIAPAGSANNVYLDFVYTNGQTSGTATFTAPIGGSYVARALLNDSPTLLAESPFAVTGVSVSTDQSSYSPGATITVTYSGLPGNQLDWIAIAAAGSANNSFVAYVYTNGQTSGTATFTAPASGTYVARALLNDSPTLAAESAPFTVSAGPAVSTDQSSYSPGATITVTYSGLPGNAKDWIAIAAAGSANNSYIAYVYTDGQTSGTATFTAPASGTYVARALLNDSPTLAAESAPFTINAGPAVSTDHSNYAPGATITVTYSGLPGNAKDWIAIAAAGSANNSYVDYVYTDGQTSGTATFVVNTPGIFVARSLTNDGPNLAAESAMFTVCGDGGGTLCFLSALSGAQEVPANSTTATGVGFVIFDPATLGISYQVRHTVVNPSVGHIHQAPPGVIGPVIVPFTLNGQGASGSDVLSQGEADDLQAGNLYMNVHSPTFPGGEVRGVLLRP